MKVDREIKAIILDKDGVFVDFEKMWGRIVPLRAQTIAEHAMGTWDLFEKVRTASIAAMGIDPETEMPDPHSPGSSMPFGKVRVALAASLYTIMSDGSDYTWQEAFRAVDKAMEEVDKNLDYVGYAEPVEGAIEKINELSDKGFQMAVFTSDTQDHGERTVEKFEVKDCFEFVQGGETKTATLFQNICSRLGVSPSEALMVGDTPKELEEAKKAGAFTVGVLSGCIKEETRDIFDEDYVDVVIPSLAQLEVEASAAAAKKNMNKESNKNAGDDTVEIFTDGASRGNPGEASVGASLVVDGREVATVSKTLGVATNNVAEYTALIEGLSEAKSLGFKNVIAKADSELMIKQLRGEYKVKNAALAPLFQKAKKLETEFSSVEYIHVKRDQNKRADELANIALDSRL